MLAAGWAIGARNGTEPIFGVTKYHVRGTNGGELDCRVSLIETKDWQGIAALARDAATLRRNQN